MRRAIGALVALVACGARTGVYLPESGDAGAAGRDSAVSARSDATRDAALDVSRLPDAKREDRTAPRDAEVDTAHDALHGHDVHDTGADALRDTGVDVVTDAPADRSLPLTAPRPIAPLSTSRVTRPKPTLHWELPPGVPDVSIDLCLDRACAMPITPAPVHVTGTSYAPDAALPIGVVFWQLHPGTSTTVTSASWELTVGAGNAPVDTSWGTTLDVNGDGYADVVVGAANVPPGGSASIYLGQTEGLGAVPTTTLASPNPVIDGFGASVASAGDVNGDGYADLIVGVFSTARTSEGAYLYLGGPTGLPGTPSMTLTLPVPDAGLIGTQVASAGDVNGDGYADVIVGVGSPFVSSAYVYLGSATGLSTTPSITLSAPAGMQNDHFGVSVASAGDVNGDGYGDVVVAGWDAISAVVYLGGPSGLATAPATVLASPEGGSVVVAVAGAGDVNGDGYGDVILGDGLTGMAYVYLGSSAGLASTAATALVGPDGRESDYGAAVASAGDVNGDGYGDIVVGAPNVYATAYVYLGGAAGVSTMPFATLMSPGGEFTYFGQSVSSTRDVNGFADVVVGTDEPVNGQALGAAYVYPGGPDPTTPPFALEGIKPGTNRGVCVFGATN
jgi:hypothetical protein